MISQYLSLKTDYLKQWGHRPISYDVLMAYYGYWKKKEFWNVDFLKFENRLFETMETFCHNISFWCEEQCLLTKQVVFCLNIFYLLYITNWDWTQVFPNFSQWIVYTASVYDTHHVYMILLVIDSKAFLKMFLFVHVLTWLLNPQNPTLLKILSGIPKKFVWAIFTLTFFHLRNL